MTELGAAGPDAIDAARQATERALADAEQLAPWYALPPYAAEGEAS